MEPGQDAAPPATSDPTPPPPRAPAVGGRPASAPPPARPTSDAVLKWIAAAGPELWFPATHAKQSGLPRDSLDEPLNELRLAGLVRIAAWVRGVGQGYALTTEGRTAAANPAALGLMHDLSPPADGPDEQPAEPNPELASRSQVIDLRPPVVTPILLGLNLLWFFVGVVIAVQLGVPLGTYLGSGDVGVHLRIGAVSAPELLRGEWWRLATSCFVHGNVLHLLTNLFALGMMGPVAELVWGRRRLAILYALSGLGGSCLAMALHPVSESGVPVVLVGASGAICGILASLFAWLLTFRAYLPQELVSDWTRRLGLTALLTVAISLVPGVSWEGHLGGAVAGFVTAGLLNALRFGERQRRWTAVGLLVALPVLCAASLVVAMRSGDGWAAVRHRVAAQAYDRQVVPLLDAIRPDIVRRTEDQAVSVLIRSPARRAERLPAVRQRVEELRQACDDAASQLPGPPSGSPTVDRYRRTAHTYAVARAKSLELLLPMLDTNELPTVEAWKAWAAARRDADKLWGDLARR